MEAEAGTMRDQGKVDSGPKKPTLHKMVLEALANNKTSKGLSIKGIKRVITTEHPETQENFSNKRLQTAVKKGLEATEIIRPKSSEQEGFKGYFILNRTLMAQKAKKNKLPKATAKSDDTTDKPKKAKSSKGEKKLGNPKATTKAAKTTKTDKDTTAVKSKLAKKKPLTAKAANVSNKSTLKAVKRRDSIVTTPKISKADKTKATKSASKRKLLSK